MAVVIIASCISLALPSEVIGDEMLQYVSVFFNGIVHGGVAIPFYYIMHVCTFPYETNNVVDGVFMVYVLVFRDVALIVVYRVVLDCVCC